MLDHQGRALPGSAPVNPLKIGRIVHGCDAEGNCAPMLVCAVAGDLLGGVVFASQMLQVQRVSHDTQPDVTTRIKVPGGHPPTWHWPAECPWNR